MKGAGSTGPFFVHFAGQTLWPMAQKDQHPDDTVLELAKDRTVLANERTFAGWTRVGVSAIGVAMAVHYVLMSVHPSWLAKLPATGMILLALYIFWVTWKRTQIALSRLRTHRDDTLSSQEVTVTTVGLALVSIAVGVLIWMM